MVRPRVSKALNPRRKLSLAQIAAGFGGKRRQAGLKRKRRSSAKKHRHAAPKANAKRRRKTNATPKKRRRATAKRRNATPKVVYRTRYKTRVKTVYRNAKPKRKASAKRRRSSNPGHYLLTMSPVGNPHGQKRKRRKTTMAKTRRKASARSRSGKRKSNPTRRRSLAKRNTHHVKRHRSRNPFGETTTQLVKDGFGVFVGFSVGKKVPPMLGPQANSSPFMSLLTTAATAGVAAWIANRVGALRPIARGVLWGGAAAVVNVAWNAWAPSQVSGYLGVGDLVPGGYPLPQVPVRYLTPGGGMDPAMVNQAPVNTGAFGSAW